MGRDYAQRAPRRRARPAGASAPTRSATASSSTATPPRRSARLWRRDGLRLVPDHAVAPRSPRRSRSYCQQATASTRRPARTRYAIVQAEDELASIGMVDRRRLERRARLHRHLGPRHLADERVHRPRLLRRDPGGDLRRAARRPLDRHADAHAAVRHARLRLRLARRHQARAAVPRGPARVLRVRRRWPSTSPTGCRRRSSSCSTSTSA